MPLGIVSLSVAQQQVMSLLNSSVGYSTTGSDTRHPDAEVQEAILEADAEVNRAIIDSSNPYRNNYLFPVYLIKQTTPPTINTATVPPPISAPSLSAVAGGVLAAGTYQVQYAWVMSNLSVTTPSPASSQTIVAGQQVGVGAVTLPAGVTAINWYMTQAGGATFSFVQQNSNGAGFNINQLPIAGDVGVTLPNYVGDPGGIEILKSDNTWVTAKTAPLAKVLMWSSNPSGIFAATQANIDGYYEIVGNRIYYVGQAARIFVASSFSITRTPTPACQAPDIYYTVVVSGALTYLLGKEGDDIQAAAHYGQLFQLGLRAIKQATESDPNALPIPDLTAYEQRR